MKRNDFEVRIVQLQSNMTNEEIKSATQQLVPICLSEKKGFCLTIHGFDSDPRELWQIPQALLFMKRLYNFGFMSCLEVSTHCEAFLNTQHKLPGFGALELWLCVKNKMKTNMDLPKSLILSFLQDLERANKKADAICKEPRYHYELSIMDAKLDEMSRSQSIPDASIRHGGIKFR